MRWLLGWVHHGHAPGLPAEAYRAAAQVTLLIAPSLLVIPERMPASRQRRIAAEGRLSHVTETT